MRQQSKIAFWINNQNRPLLQKKEIGQQKAHRFAGAVRSESDDVAVAVVTMVDVSERPFTRERMILIARALYLTTEIDSAIGLPD
jgi:hypothetical protein